MSACRPDGVQCKNTFGDKGTFYCVVTITQVTSKDRARILMLFLHDDSLTPVEPLLQDLHLKFFQKICRFSIYLFAFSCLSPEAYAATCLKDLFETTGSTSCLTRRKASGSVLVPLRNTKRSVNTLVFRGTSCQLQWRYAIPSARRSLDVDYVSLSLSLLPETNFFH